MFCKNCGTENSDNSIYCANDGVLLNHFDSYFRLEKEQIKFCKACSNENEMDALYCTSCGRSLQKPVKKSFFSTKQSTQNSTNATNQINTYEGFSSLLTVDNLLHSLKFAGIVFAIMFVFSFIISKVINKAFIDSLGVDDPFFGGIFDSLKLIGTTDILMASHLININYVAELIGFFEGSLKTSGGMIIFLIIPAIAMVITGFVLTKLKPNLSVTDRLYSSLSIAIIYAAIIGFFGIFSGVSFSVEDPNGIFPASTISANYSFIEAFIKSFLIGIIFITLGSLITIPKGEGSNVKYVRSVGRAIVSTVLGIALMMIISNVVIGDKLSEEADLPKPMATALTNQFGGYFWNLAHFGKLNFVLNVYDEEDIEASYSILGGAKASEEEEGFKIAFKNSFGSLWYLLLIPIIIHIWSGFILKKASTGNILHELGAYALIFGFINAIFVSLTSFSANLSFGDLFDFSLGFSTIVMFILSALVAFVLSYVGGIIFDKVNSRSKINIANDAA